MSKSHTQRLREEQERRRRARAEREAAEQAAEGLSDAAAGTDVAAADQSSDASPAHRGPQRPQPFTPDLLPSTDAVEASGVLSADELDELERCERAFANADQAQWMRGLALHAVRDRRLYRDGGRTWPEYCEEIGLSESDANRLIQEYPLARAIAQIWVTPKMVPASHVRALLPLESKFGLDGIASGYVRLRSWAQTNGQRVTAADLTAIIDRSSYELNGSDGPLPVAEFLARRKELEAGVPAQAKPPQSETQRSAPEVESPERVSPESHPNLGGSGGLGLPGPAHPNLGGSPASDEEVVDAELVDDAAARAFSRGLADLAQGVDGTLVGASAETLKSIEASARRILDATLSALTAT
ncbi:hypothetical protein ACFYNM_21820 [Streptomyces spororaveus]|uniref:hypothetical protein n=1 Tax=Streptomyces spororaveus TaxID=284039 RepID=UPI00369D947C